MIAISSVCISTRQFLGGREIGLSRKAYLYILFTRSILTRLHQTITTTMAINHHIIALDSWLNLPEFDFPHSLKIITDGSALTRPDQLKDATIAINSQVPVNAALLDHMPNLKLLAVTGTGIDHIDNKALRARGVVLCKVPAQNTGKLLQLGCIDRLAEHRDRRFSERARFCVGLRIETPDLANASNDGRRKEMGGDSSTTSCFWPASQDECRRNAGQYRIVD